jgi:hypothetical protein
MPNPSRCTLRRIRKVDQKSVFPKTQLDRYNTQSSCEAPYDTWKQNVSSEPWHQMDRIYQPHAPVALAPQKWSWLSPTASLDVMPNKHPGPSTDFHLTHLAITAFRLPQPSKLQLIRISRMVSNASGDTGIEVKSVRPYGSSPKLFTVAWSHLNSYIKSCPLNLIYIDMGKIIITNYT